MADIVKHQLMNMIKDRASFLKAEDLSLEDTTVEYLGDGPSWCQVAIKGPHDKAPRVFEIRLTEKKG